MFNGLVSRKQTDLYWTCVTGFLLINFQQMILYSIVQKTWAIPYLFVLCSLVHTMPKYTTFPSNSTFRITFLVQKYYLMPMKIYLLFLQIQFKKWELITCFRDRVTAPSAPITMDYCCLPPPHLLELFSKLFILLQLLMFLLPDVGVIWYRFALSLQPSSSVCLPPLCPVG